MTDLTSDVSSLLEEKHHTTPLSEHRRTLAKLDSFLAEAYQINASISALVSYLRASRQPYLSTAPPPRRTHSTTKTPVHFTDADREVFESESAQLIRDLNASITNLNQAASLRADTDTRLLERKYGKPDGFLWRWAAGEGDMPDAGKPPDQIQDEGQLKSMRLFREGVLWYLGNRLQGAASMQQAMVEIRVGREREREASVLYKAKTNRVLGDWSAAPNGVRGDMDMHGQNYDAAVDDTERRRIEETLTPEQLQLFESENSTLLNHYNDTLSKVTQAEKSLLEIASLQQTLVGHLTVQSEMIGQLVEDAENTEGNVQRGNKELKKASERSSTAKGVFWVTVGLCGFLVGWDLVF